MRAVSYYGLLDPALLYGRVLRGGGRVSKVSPKAARIEIRGCSLMDLAYFRNALLGMYESSLGLFGERVSLRAAPSETPPGFGRPIPTVFEAFSTKYDRARTTSFKVVPHCVRKRVSRFSRGSSSLLWPYWSFRMNLRISLCTLVVAAGALGACSSSDPDKGSSSGGSSAANSAGASHSSGGSGGSGQITPSGGGGQTSGAAGNGSGASGESGAPSGGSSSGAPGSGGAAGASGAMSSGGSAGQAPVNGQCIFPSTASERKAPAFALPAPTNPKGIVLRLMNNCPIDLWVSGANLQAVELPPKQAGGAPAEKVYDWPGGGGRITAYLNSANGFNMAFIEFNAARGKALNVDNSYVDWVGLPIEVKGNDTASCLTACYQPYEHMMDECPQHLIDTTHKICQAPKNWCGIGNNATDPICTGIVAAAAATAAADPSATWARTAPRTSTVAAASGTTITAAPSSPAATKPTSAMPTATA